MARFLSSCVMNKVLDFVYGRCSHSKYPRQEFKGFSWSHCMNIFGQNQFLHLIKLGDEENEKHLFTQPSVVIGNCYHSICIFIDTMGSHSPYLYCRSIMNYLKISSISIPSNLERDFTVFVLHGSYCGTSITTTMKLFRDKRHRRQNIRRPSIS